MKRVKNKQNVRGMALTGALIIHVAAAIGLYLWKVGDNPPQGPVTELSVAFPSTISGMPSLQQDSLTSEESADPGVVPEHTADEQHEAGTTVAKPEDTDEVRVRNPVHSILFDIQWKKGGERRKLGGLAPVFPPDLQPGARIQVDVALQQDGRVKNVRVVKSSDDRMKEPSLRAVRHWRFDLPKRGSPRGDQTCLITFRVRAK